VIVHPRHKDLSDGEAALHLAIAAGASDITIEGTLGERSDHLLSTFHLLHLVPDGISGRLHLGKDTITLLKPGRRVIRDPPPLISLLPASEKVRITTQGLLFPLRDEWLTMGSTRGVHNEPASGEPWVEVSDGMAYLILSPGTD